MVVARKAPDTERDTKVISTIVLHLARELRTALDRRFTRHGLTAQQAAVLILSRVDQNPSPARMADRLGTDGAGMTRLLDRLEAKGLVVRRARSDDRRAIRIGLAPSSKLAVARLVPELRRANAELLDGFSETEVKQLRSMLIRLLKNARRLQR